MFKQDWQLMRENVTTWQQQQTQQNCETIIKIQIYTTLHFVFIYTKQVIILSGGELKKVQSHVQHLKQWLKMNKKCKST